MVSADSSWYSHWMLWFLTLRRESVRILLQIIQTAALEAAFFIASLHVVHNSLKLFLYSKFSFYTHKACPYEIWGQCLIWFYICLEESSRFSINFSGRRKGEKRIGRRKNSKYKKNEAYVINIIRTKNSYLFHYTKQPLLK